MAVSIWNSGIVIPVHSLMSPGQFLALPFPPAFAFGNDWHNGPAEAVILRDVVKPYHLPTLDSSETRFLSHGITASKHVICNAEIATRIARASSACRPNSSRINLPLNVRVLNTRNRNRKKDSVVREELLEKVPPYLILAAQNQRLCTEQGQRSCKSTEISPRR